MKNDFLIVHKSILPAYYDDVIKAREEIENKNISVSDAVKQFHISRSTYYKYKDYIFKVAQERVNKVMLSFKTMDEKGILGQILIIMTESNANVVSISQEPPLNKVARININIDISDLNCELNGLLEKLRNLEYVNSVEIVAFA